MIIWLICVLGCALVFTIIGIYAYRLKTPMHFYSGIKVSSDEISDIRSYNQANGLMWIFYSIWFWITGPLICISLTAAMVILILGCTVGIIGLVYSYRKIYNRYSVKTR